MADTVGGLLANDMLGLLKSGDGIPRRGNAGSLKGAEGAKVCRDGVELPPTLCLIDCISCANSSNLLRVC